MTAPSHAVVPETAVAETGHEGRRWPLPVAAPTLPQLAGVGFVLVLITVLETLRRPAGMDPSVLVPVLVVAATVVGGFVGGALAAVAGAAYVVVYSSQPELVGPPGAGARVATTVIASAVAVWLTGMLRDRHEQARTAAAFQQELGERIQAFTLTLANQAEEHMPDALVRGASQLLDTDMAVLTLLDPQSGRHFVRAVHGGGAAAMGVEVIPGVGVTGQAIRERRTVVAASRRPDRVRARAKRRTARSGSSSRAPQVVAALPAMQQGRVIATLTVGRSDADHPFDESDMAVLNLVTPVVTLAVSSQLQRQEMENGSPRDPQTGLYNRPYLEAALEQLIALRRRTEPADRPPLSVIMFDIDSFGQLNQRHGRQAGDAVLRGVATILRQRFRASDILARVGPDSFFAVLNGADADVAAEAAAQIRRQVRELNVPNSRGEPIVVSISAGCAVFHDGDSGAGLFRSVEAALDTARWSGPGAVVSI